MTNQETAPLTELHQKQEMLRQQVAHPQVGFGRKLWIAVQTGIIGGFAAMFIGGVALGKTKNRKTTGVAAIVAASIISTFVFDNFLNRRKHINAKPAQQELEKLTAEISKASPADATPEKETNFRNVIDAERAMAGAGPSLIR